MKFGLNAMLAAAPWLPNVKGMRYEKGKLVPRKSQA